MKLRWLPVFLFSLALPLFGQQKSILFDAMHAQTAGNADWTLDEDSCGIAQRFPTPDQSGITSSTPETYWKVTAIRAFVQNGGGLLMIADHAGADRNNDGWEPPAIFNDLMGSPSLFGITYNTSSADRTYGWFDDHPDVNYTTDTTSQIIYTGPFGSPSSTKGLGLFGSTSMTITGAAKGHIWRTVATHDTSSGVTFATSTYGTGRIAAVGDSSITEDATNGCGHTTYLGAGLRPPPRTGRIALCRRRMTRPTMSA